MKTSVGIVRCSSYHYSRVKDSVMHAVRLVGGIEKFVSQGQKVLIKPNMLAARTPDKAVTTHPSIVRAVIEMVKEAGGIPFVGDSPALQRIEKVAEKTGILEVIEKTGAQLVPFTNSTKITITDDFIFRDMEIAKEVSDADVVINLPKLKTHTQMLLTLAVKNLFGCIVGRRKAQWHLKAGIDRNAFAKMLLEVYSVVKPSVSIVDGIVGMDGNGPSNGKPTHTGLIISGVDCVAIDRVICEIVGVNANDLAILRVAVERGIGVPELNRILVKGEKIGDVKVERFELPENVSTEFGPPFLRSYLKDYLTPKPKENRKKCTLCKSCVQACPPGVIEVSEKGLNFDYDKCIRCFCCQEICPEGAMEIKKSLLANLLTGF